MASDVVEVWLRGGLGNQLFQYAAGVHASKILGNRLIIRSDLLPQQPDEFKGVQRWPEQITSFAHEGVVLRCAAQPEGRTSILSKAWTAANMAAQFAPKFAGSLNYVCDESWLLNPRKPQAALPVTLAGYFICSDFAEANASNLVKSLTSVKEESALSLEIKKVVERTVGIHLRLGDHHFLEPDKTEMKLAQIQQQLIDVRREGLEKYTLFSDSLGQASNLLAKAGIKNFQPIDTSMLRPIETLNVMASCSRLLGTGSTFGWWARFLISRKQTA